MMIRESLDLLATGKMAVLDFSGSVGIPLISASRIRSHSRSCSYEAGTKVFFLEGKVAIGRN